MDAANHSPDSVNLNAKAERWQIIFSYILASLAAMIIPLALFLPAFIRLEENSAGLGERPLLRVETFWEFSVVASFLLIVIAIGAVVLLLIKRPRKVVYIALAITLVCLGASYLHERAREAELKSRYITLPANSNAPREVQKAVERLAESLNEREHIFFGSETYGRAWTFMFAASFAFLVSWLLQFSGTEYKRAWNWTLSKVPVFEQKFKQCQSCGGSNYFEASRCKHCNTPFTAS